jgi:2-C-methyl-D-erythritol 4-phosphate cytidylyltransferase/2-C-methyl-D-erythritol 2,4-cyclodiphosphate synthase
MRVAVVVVAAGSGSRLGRGEPKAFVELAGVSILERALRGVRTWSTDAALVVVAPAGRVADAETIARRVAPGIAVVAGGAHRQASVAAGLALVTDDVDVVLVHDAARPLTPPEQFDAVVAAVTADGGAVPGIPVPDTLKRVEHLDGGRDRILETVDRSELVAMQTPQGFPRGPLLLAYAAADREHTDDAALFALAGHPVVVVPGSAAAAKITTEADLRRATQSLRRGSRSEGDGMRTGIGIDVHAYDEAAPLWLGGVYWPGEPGLAGHSDGDAVIHAMCDALLSAAGLGDIGGRFGSDDPRFAGARSELFLRDAREAVAGAGFGILNVAVQVVANRPRIATRRSEVEALLGGLVGAPVSVAGTTADHLGFTGRGEGVSVIATALLSRLDG